MSIPIRGYQELHKTVHDGFGREVCQRKCADIHFQNLSGATCPLRFTVPQYGPRAPSTAARSKESVFDRCPGGQRRA